MGFSVCIRQCSTCGEYFGGLRAYEDKQVCDFCIIEISLNRIIDGWHDDSPVLRRRMEALANPWEGCKGKCTTG